MADGARDVAVEVIFGDGGEVDGAGGCFVGVACHAGFHFFFGNVDDDGLVPEEKSGFGSDMLVGKKRT